jgi:putative nucleotide binding protein
MSGPEPDPDSGPDRESEFEEDAAEGEPAAENEDTAGAEPVFVVLDFLLQGRPDDRQHSSEKAPLAHAIGEDSFRLIEITVARDADISFGDRLAEDDAAIERTDDIAYEDLTSTAQSELEYVLEEIADREERRFVDIYNDAQPITLRLHQLNLLPGIGKKLRNTILDERKRSPFESFADVEERVSGLHDPRQVLIDRVLEELREDDLKYRMFVREE